jgi:hypothetical protein
MNDERNSYRRRQVEYPGEATNGPDASIPHRSRQAHPWQLRTCAPTSPQLLALVR